MASIINFLTSCASCRTHDRAYIQLLRFIRWWQSVGPEFSLRGFILTRFSENLNLVCVRCVFNIHSEEENNSEISF